MILTNVKRVQLLHVRFLLFNCPDQSQRRTLVEKRGQPVEIRALTNRINLHPAILFVPNPSM